MEGTHRKLVAVSLVGSELPTKVSERIEGMFVVEAFLVFAVAAFDLAIMAGRVRANQLVTDRYKQNAQFKQFTCMKYNFTCPYVAIII